VVAVTRSNLVMHNAVGCLKKCTYEEGEEIAGSELHEEGEETAGSELSGSEFVATTLVTGFSKAYLLPKGHKLARSHNRRRLRCSLVGACICRTSLATRIMEAVATNWTSKFCYSTGG